MFGREPERAQIEQVLDAGTARPAGIVLEGDPGIGKTTLLREALAGAAGRSFQTLVASPSEPEAGLSFAGLGDLISGVVDGLLDALPGPQRHAVSAALSLEDASQAPADPLALPRGILTILSELSAQGPLLVAIDDEQWVDQASGQVLAFALGRLRAAPICLLMTRRPESGGALWRELARSFGGHGLEHLAVTPLDLPAIEALLKEQLKMTIPRSLVRRVHHTCGGNPLFALAIARELKPQHVADHEVPLPRTLSDAMHERLRDVAPVASDALLAVASVSRATLALLRAALPQFTADELDTALDADVIEIRGEQVRFTHPLLASTHYARTPPSRRRRLHRALAQVVVDEEERARHLALGASGPDSDVALTLEDAAGAAALRGAPAAAALLLEDAVLLTPSTDADAQRVRRIAAAEQHWAAGNADRARSLLEDVVPELTPGPLRARAFDALSLVRNDDWRVSEALLEQALGDLSGHDRDRSRVESHLVGLLVNRAKFIAMLTHARSAVESAERAGDDGALAEALAGLATAEFFNGRRVNRAALGRAIELEETDVTSTYNLPSTTQGFILFWGDEHAAAREVLEQSAVRAADRGEEYDRVAIVFHLAILEWRVGNWESAMRHHADVASMLGQGEVSNDMWVILGESLFALGRGELDLARERARDALAIGDRIGDVMIAALPAMVLAEIDLRSGKPSAAHERIAPIRERLVENGFGFLG